MVPLLDAATDILNEFEAAGYKLTIRALFYRLVSIGLLTNTDAEYIKLQNMTRKARWSGLWPMDCFDEEGRNVTRWRTERSPRQALLRAANSFRTDWWEDADPLVEVWAEKRTANTFLEPVCRDWGVTYFACEGYASNTAQFEAVKRWAGRFVVILYVGDHDPAGINMDESAETNLHDMGADFEFRRLGITPVQAIGHGLEPLLPNHKDRHYKRFIELGYYHCWELDALPHEELIDLVDDAIGEYAPYDLAERQAADEAERARIREFAEGFHG